MKRSYLLCALVLTLLLFSGCAKQQEQMTYIGAEAAKQLALDTSGLTAAEVDSITADLNTRNGLDYYQVDLTAAGQDYQYDIDALTGAIIESDSPVTEPENSLGTDADIYNQTSVSTEEDGTGNNAAAEIMTVDEAKDKALTHAGLTSDQVIFVKSKLDYKKGRQIYDVEFYTVNFGIGNTREYDYEIDASTGEVVSFDYDVKGASAAPSGSAITTEQAKELALAQVPGATASDIREFKTDYDDGRTEYEGEIVFDGMKYEFEIDGYSGAIRSWEAEPVGR